MVSQAFRNNVGPIKHQALRVEREFEPFESGIVLQNCTIKATRDSEKLDNVTTYLGRLWGIFSRTVIMENYIDTLINPKGWVEWIE
uniref:Pectinesterase n=1 Tax=Solanum lycopersicum TaxID=4081 RepID=K4D8R5_SOLLC